MAKPAYATINDVTLLWRQLTPAEQTRAAALLPVISDALRVEALRVGKDLDEMIRKDETGGSFLNAVKSVTVDILSRMLLSSTENEPMSQFSQSALGYTVSGTYLTPGGGLFIKKAELARLGLRRQKIGVIDLA